MRRDEAKKILMIVQTSYPNWHPLELSFTVDIWNIMLADYSYEEISQALKRYILTDTKGFAPSIGQIVANVHLTRETSEMSELEAWSMVYKAICNSNYNAEAEFEKLPQTIKVAVGNFANLREWAQMDTDTVQSVEQSHFIRSYRTAIERQKTDAKLPQNLKGIIYQSAKTDEIGGKLCQQ